jgi:membrane protein required for colicin V production
MGAGVPGSPDEQWADMNALDWIFIVMIGASALYGLLKGLVREVVSIIAVLLGLAAASRGYRLAIPLFKDFGVSQELAGVLSFLLIFVVVYIVIILLGKLIQRLLHTRFLGCANRLGGAVFGFVRGVIISGIIVVLLTVTLSEKAAILMDSKLTPYVMTISRVLVSLAPEGVKDRFMEQEKKLREEEKKLKPQKREKA